MFTQLSAFSTKQMVSTVQGSDAKPPLLYVTDSLVLGMVTQKRAICTYNVGMQHLKWADVSMPQSQLNSNLIPFSIKNIPSMMQA